MLKRISDTTIIEVWEEMLTMDGLMDIQINQDGVLALCRWIEDETRKKALGMSFLDLLRWKCKVLYAEYL